MCQVTLLDRCMLHLNTNPYSLVLFTYTVKRLISEHLNVYRLVLQMHLPNPLKPGAKSQMKMQSEHRRQAMLQLHLSDQ